MDNRPPLLVMNWFRILWCFRRLLLVQTQQWKHNGMWNLLKVNTKCTEQPLVSLMLILNRIDTLCWCLLCWIWTCQWRLFRIIYCYSCVTASWDIHNTLIWLSESKFNLIVAKSCFYYYYLQSLLLKFQFSVRAITLVGSFSLISVPNFENLI